MENYTTIKDFALAISRITQDEDGRYTWETFAPMFEEPCEFAQCSPWKFRTNPDGRGVWCWSEYLCDWRPIRSPYEFSLVCEPSEQVRRVVALHMPEVLEKRIVIEPRSFDTV